MSFPFVYTDLDMWFSQLEALLETNEQLKKQVVELTEVRHQYACCVGRHVYAAFHPRAILIIIIIIIKHVSFVVGRCEH